jgi:membrane fusion protein (multidrug efflux system)
MATAFTRTLRTLEPHGARRFLIMTVPAAVVLAAWTTWGTLAQVTLYEVSGQTRLEVDRAAHSVDSPASGRVVESRLRLGQEVAAGEVLLRLDGEAEGFSLREEREKVTALEVELAALHAQASSIGQGRAEAARAAHSGLEEARERLHEAEAPAQYAEQELGRLERLRVELLISERAFEQGRAEAQRTKAAAASSRLSPVRIAEEQSARDRDRGAALDQVRAQLAHIEGQLRGSQAVVLRLGVEAERYVVRAPAAGRLGDVAALRSGSVVHAGQRLGVIVPVGRLIAVAQFSPSSAIGRIRPGQPARLSLDGFPWAQYGTVDATVLHVANEVRDDRVRVELAVAEGSNPRIAIEHGLTGTSEVSVEQVAPFVLLLRAAGALGATSAPVAQAGE